MANYFNPMYNPYLTNYPQYQQQVQQPVQQNVQPSIQQGGFIPVSSEKEALDYLVAQGTSVTFIDGKNQKMYVKTRSFSPIEQPSFKRFNLVEITDENTIAEPDKTTAYEDEILRINTEIENLKNEVKKLSEAKADE